MTTVYLLRHAEYESPNYIVPFRLPGFPLSNEGKLAAEKLAGEFSKTNIATIYSSPLTRTRETAEIIAKKLGKEVQFDDRLLEVRSSAQGKTEEFLHSMNGWHIYDSDWYKSLNGERPEEILARMESFMQEKVAANVGKEIIVVSHGDPIMFYLSHYYNKPVTDIPYVQMGQFLPLVF